MGLCRVDVKKGLGCKGGVGRVNKVNKDNECKRNGICMGFQREGS